MPNIPKMWKQQFKLWKKNQAHSQKKKKKQEKWPKNKLGDK